MYPIFIEMNLVDICEKLDDLSTQYSLEKIKGFRGDEYIVSFPTSPLPCVDFSLSAVLKVREYLFAARH